MTRHLVTEIEKLKKEILGLGALVEETVSKAVKAVVQRNVRLADSIIESDSVIDQKEVEIEEECLKILALHQPVAIDLRFIIAVLKMNNDLERIADLAGNIASRARSLSLLPPVELPFDLEEMTVAVKKMLKETLDALINLDGNLAHEICRSDDAVDEMNRKVYKAVQDKIKEDPAHVESYILALSVSRNLERIGDHATNIAEDVIYMIEGRIVRHRAV